MEVRKTIELSINIILGFGLLILLFILLTLEIMHRTLVSLLVLSIVIALNLIIRFTDFDTLIRGVDLDTILLLMCMMIIVGILSKTGIFQYLASKLTSRFYLHPVILVSILSGFTALTSAFIDNVTTVLLVTPVALTIFTELGIDPRPVLLAIIFSSNIGGTATLIGDPPNIIIGTVARLGFMSFIKNLTPIVVISFFIFLLIFKLMNRTWIRNYIDVVNKKRNIAISCPSVDSALLKKVLSVLAVVISLFFLEDVLKYPPAVPAMIGAGVLIGLTRKYISLEDVIRFIDWSTLVFFMAMFIIVKGIEELGTIDFIARGIAVIARSTAAALMLILWVSALLSAFIDNIPFVMAMVPVIPIVASMLGIDPKPLYWALSLGACFGGNGTAIGASANVVVIGIAEKYGYHISFKYFMKYGLVTVLVTVGISAVYLIIRYAL